MLIRPLAGLSVTLLLLLLVSAPAPPAVAAQGQAAVRFIETSAEADFPRTIQFHLRAETDLSVTEVQLFWRESGSSTLTLAEPEVTPGEQLTATYMADMTVTYLPPGLDIEYFWRITDETGAVHDSPIETLFYMDGRFEWQSLEAGLVTVWWYQGSDSYARAVAASANRTLARLAEDFGLQTSDPIRILMYSSDSDFSGALRANSADWIGGVAYSALSHILAHIAPTGSADREIGRMIPHEISHVVVHHASRNPYNTPPPWLDEGLATYIQDTPDSRLPSILDDAVDDGRLIPLTALKSSFPADPNQALLSYAESQSIVTYLAESYGQQTVGDLVAVYQQEVSHEEAVQLTLGISLEELDTDWKAWLGYQGDRPVTRDSDASGSTALFAAIALATLLVVSGTILVLFWRTRSYADSDTEEEGVEVLPGTSPGPPQP